MSVLINARGTVSGAFRVGVSGISVGENGNFTLPTNSDMTIDLSSGRALVVNSESGTGLIRSNSQSLGITSAQLRLNANMWPVTDGMSGQVLQTDGAGKLSWVTVTGGGGTPEFDIQPAGTVLAAPSAVNGVPTFRRLTALDIPILNQNTLGNSGTASRLLFERNISMTGDASWSVNFDGSASVSSNLTLTNTGVAPGAYTKVTVDSKGRVVGGTSPSTLAGYGIIDAVTVGTQQTITTAKTFLDTTYFGLSNRGQTGAPTVMAYSSGTIPAVAVGPKESAVGRTGNFSFYGTHGVGNIYTPYRSADIWSGFDNGIWGTEYIAWGVGVGESGANDAGARTTERMRLTRNGLVCTGDISITSDERLKTGWRDLDKDVIRMLAGVTSGVYTRLDTGKIQVGVSAQSLRGVVPEAVHEHNGSYSVSYGNAAMALCVELAKKIVELEDRINGITK